MNQSNPHPKKINFYIVVGYLSIMDFNLDNISQFHLMRNGGQIKPCEPGPNGFDPAKIFMDRKKSNQSDGMGFTPIHQPDMQYFDPADVEELEQFCKSRGIIGVNFGRMNPREVLNMLKNKIGIPTESKRSTYKKTLLNG
jgi:hypothetical protein